jgi:hypothetical protein
MRAGEIDNQTARNAGRFAHLLPHLVELVDAHDAAVGKHHRARLQLPLAGSRIAHDGRCGAGG